ncbi:hypothetical protein DXG01_001481 [Tephrocybe rancida]|nr:hypothetical protein DXG01_001481 [Tephrocybe rancida]
MAHLEAWSCTLPLKPPPEPTTEDEDKLQCKGKEKAWSCTPPLEPPLEPTTEDEDEQFAADMRRATFNSTAAVQQPFPEKVVLDGDGAIIVSSDDETDIKQDDCCTNVFVDAAEENLQGQH